MSHRAEQKAAAREARLAEERAEAQRAARRRRLGILGAVVALALAGAAVAIVVTGGDDEAATPEQTASRYAGIPQDGEWLGSPDAPVVLEEYADLQCPFCAQYASEVLPAVIDEYVRPGRVRMRLRLMTFLGPDSERGAAAAVAAGFENRMWNFADDFYANQGQENSGYADDDFLRERAEAVGLDPGRVLERMDDPRVDEVLAEVASDATANGVDSTPSFRVGPRGGELEALEVQSLDPQQFRQALDAAINEAR